MTACLIAGAVAGLAPAASAQNFFPIGPAPVSNFGGASGRVADVAPSASDPNVIYIATAGGGVWKTTDGGANWTPLTDHLPAPAIGAIALDPSNEQIVYAGSGEIAFANHALYGLGLYKSLDGGQTWQVLASSTFAGRCFARLRVNRADTDVVFAAICGAGGGPERLAARGHPQRNGPFGVFRSIDAGHTWAQLTGGLPSEEATDLVLDPVDPAVMYACIGNPYGAPGNGIYKSIDAGQTWTMLGGGLPAGMGRSSIAIAPTNRLRLYAFVAEPSTGIGVGGSSSGGGGQMGAFRSDDGGMTWTSLPLASIMAAQGFYNQIVAVHPTNPDIAFFGGVTLRRTDNAGATFTGNLPQHHPDDHGVAFDAAGRLIMGNDGGICRSDDLGASFVALNAGLGNMQCYAGFSTHPTNDFTIFTGLQDNGTARRDSDALLWTSVSGGDGGWTQVNQSDPSFVYVQSQGAGSLRRSTNGGMSFASAGSGLTGRHCFLPPFLLDPRDPSRILWANERVFESLDGGTSFAPISPDLTTGSPFAIRAMAMAPSDPDRVYVATNDSRVLGSTDGGRTFTLLRTDALGWPRITREIEVSPSDPLTVYLAGARFGGPHVRRSRDGGQTWETLDGNLPDVPVNVVAVDDRFPTGRLYLGTDAGVFFSRDAGATWRRLGPESGPGMMPRAAVIDLRLETQRPAVAGTTGGRMIVSTQGRGMWLAPLACVADFNADGNIDADDLGDYINCYFGVPACAESDFNGDTEVNADDLGDFINAFFTPGC
ncbi:MAG: hypothetical protein AB7K52_08180 [Phycisphaerales bacterium]